MLLEQTILQLVGKRVDKARLLVACAVSMAQIVGVVACQKDERPARSGDQPADGTYGTPAGPGPAQPPGVTPAGPKPVTESEAVELQSALDGLADRAAPGATPIGQELEGELPAGPGTRRDGRARADRVFHGNRRRLGG